MRNVRTVLFLTAALVLSACGQKTESTVPAVTAEVKEQDKYGGVELLLSEDEFAEEGFQLGDSVDISFSNGYTITDVPYYNGYYVNYGEPVLVAYPGREHIIVNYNYQELWHEAGLAEGDTAAVTMCEAGAYSDIQDVFGQDYSVKRKTYESDEEFCNFRALTGGNLKENFLYRGASPVDNSRSRAAYTDGLIKEHNIRFIVDLADTQDDINTFTAQDDFQSPYWQSLYEEGDLTLLGMGTSFEAEDFAEKLVTGLRKMMNAEGPVYIHCTEGKDRTGFVCTVLEALAGADYEEMLRDYMRTYSNYYKVTETDTPDKYEAISELYFDAFVSWLHNSEDIEELKAADYTADAEAYLEAGGMTHDEVQQLKAFITED